MTELVKRLRDEAHALTRASMGDKHAPATYMAASRLHTAAADEIERLNGIVRVFLDAAYPVATEINARGYNWSEAYLDQARKSALGG